MCIKKGQFHIDLILVAFMQILLWNDMGRNELILDDLDLRTKKDTNENYSVHLVCFGILKLTKCKTSNGSKKH